MSYEYFDGADWWPHDELTINESMDRCTRYFGDESPSWGEVIYIESEIESELDAVRNGNYSAWQNDITTLTNWKTCV